jgi:hypothetical protein
MKNLNRFIVLGTAAFFILVMAAGFNDEAGCEEHPAADSAVIETPKAAEAAEVAEEAAEVAEEAAEVAEEAAEVAEEAAELPKAEHPKAEHPTTDHPK